MLKHVRIIAGLAVLATVACSVGSRAETAPCLAPEGQPGLEVREAGRADPALAGDGLGALAFRSVVGTLAERPVHSVTLTLHAPGVDRLSEPLRGISTDSAGAAVLDSLPSGTYALLVRRIGTMPSRYAITVRSGMRDTAVVRLRLETICF